jgi:CubicO group peptidase (beta-lactamase class C family)
MYLVKKYITVFLILCFISIPSINAKASSNSTIIDLEELSTFTDAFFSKNMYKYHVPGAAIAIVKDGETCFIKGYGYSDVENKKSIDPQKTIFGIASVSKLITATAVMQQYEKGKIDLNKDINEYLSSFKIEESFDKPITMKSLLTHTSGFNQSSIGIGVRNSSEIKNLSNYLSNAIPKRVNEPNRFFSYSNQGVSLAGYIVEIVAGEKFGSYVNEKIFKPLKMNSSTFDQPIPENMEKDKAIGYGYWTQKKNLFRTEPLYYQVMPAGACYTTVSDMAKFISANLNNGSYEKSQLLKETTMEEMHKQQFTHNPKMPGQAYGFWESFENNKRGLFHTGTSDGYASLLYIMPEYNMGFILCYNLATDKLRSDFLRSFLDKFFPVEKTIKVNPVIDFEKRVKQFEGLYWDIEKPRYTLDKLEVLMSNGLIKARAQKDGTLKLTGYYGDKIGNYIEIEPEVFKNIETEEIVTFRLNNPEYNYNYLFIKNNAFKKVSWYENPTLIIVLALLSLLIIISSPIILIRAYIYKKLISTDIVGLGRYTVHIATLATVLILIFCTIAAIVTSRLGKYAFMFGIPLSIKFILLIPIILCFVFPFLFIISILAWKNKYWTFAYRSFFTVFTVANVIFLVVLKYWNMIVISV